MVGNTLRRCRRVLRLVIPCAVLLSGGGLAAVAQPAIIPEGNHKFLGEEEGAKVIIEDIQKINVADQQLAAAMFLKILSVKMPAPNPMVNYPALIGRPQPFVNSRGEAPKDKPVFDLPRMARQAASTEVLCAVLKGEIPGFGKCAATGSGLVVTHTSAGASADKWRIDQPTVNSPTTEYKTVALAAGDKIAIAAGGCAQTGIFGPSWKKFVDPQGPGSDHLYYGTIQIRGAEGFAQPARLSQWVGRAVTIPDGASNAMLILGYEHDHYWNAGYYGHDDGTADQCKNIGPAWVELQVEHHRNP
jgi:hypothetical protein